MYSRQTVEVVREAPEKPASRTYAAVGFRQQRNVPQADFGISKDVRTVICPICSFVLLDTHDPTQLAGTIDGLKLGEWQSTFYAFLLANALIMVGGRCTHLK